MTTGGGTPWDRGSQENDRPPGAPPPELGAPYPGGYGYPDRQAGSNPLAIFALVSSVLGVLAVGLVGGTAAVLGIVLGAVALSQIKRRPQGGHGLAVAAIVVGVGTLLVSVILRVLALNT